MRSKVERIVSAGLEQLWLRFPFHIAGIHSDNGSEFINHHLARWCATRKITFTRGRSSHKNDQAHVEQKNWSVVRRNVGYFRYDTPQELDLLNQLWPPTSSRCVTKSLTSKPTSSTSPAAEDSSSNEPRPTPSTSADARWDHRSGQNQMSQRLNPRGHLDMSQQEPLLEPRDCAGFSGR